MHSSPKAWKQENDKTWLFDLVDSAVFHNGEPFTSQDVVYTFTRLLDAKNKLPMRIFFSPVRVLAITTPSPMFAIAVSRIASPSRDTWPPTQS